MVQGALPQEGAKLLVLRRAQTCRSATGNGGLKATVTLQAGFPGVHGVYRHAEVLSNLPVSMRPTFNPFKRGQAALLKLSAGILGRLPSGHTASLPIHTYTVINSAHTAQHLVFLKHGLKQAAGVLAPPITVMKQPWWWIAALYTHFQGL